MNQGGGALPLRVNLVRNFDYFELEQNMRHGDDLMWAKCWRYFGLELCDESTLHNDSMRNDCFQHANFIIKFAY